MKATNTLALAVASILWMAAAGAQTPSTGTAAQPEAASSPHQREATSTTGATEAPTSDGAGPADASTPHQREVTGASGTAEPSRMAHGVSPDKFVSTAAQDGMTEVKLAKLAMLKSTNPEVRKFAAHMEKDHGQANAELAGLAANKGIRIPTVLDAEHEDLLSQMGSKSGVSFDSAFADHMVKAHQQAVDLFRAGSSSPDTQIAAFAAKTLPTLEEHQKEASSLESRMKLTEADSAAATSNR